MITLIGLLAASIGSFLSTLPMHRKLSIGCSMKACCQYCTVSAAGARGRQGARTWTAAAGVWAHHPGWLIGKLEEAGLKADLALSDGPLSHALGTVVRQNAHLLAALHPVTRRDDAHPLPDDLPQPR
jgi:hypothetical protein